MWRVLILSVLFLGYVAARKRTKKNGVGLFRACGRDEGAALDLQTFEKV